MRFSALLVTLIFSLSCQASFFIPNGSVTTPKLNAQIVNSATTATIVPTDYVLIADTSASGAVKKALVSDINAYLNRQAGQLVQVVHQPYTTYSTAAGVIPQDGTIPQITEGTEVFTASFTPKSATNKLKITVVLHGNMNSANVYAVCLFQDAVANALACGEGNVFAANAPHTVTYIHWRDAGTTSAITFRLRVGPPSGTVYINGYSGTNYLGGKLESSITIEEIAQ